MSVAARVAQTKEAHPERYCPESRCLWRTGGPRCPRHTPKAIIESAGLEYVGEQERPKSNPPGHLFNASTGSTLMLTEVTTATLAAKLEEHRAAFPLEHQPLRSCYEVAEQLCICGDACAEGQESCPACARERNRKPIEWAEQYKD